MKLPDASGPDKPDLGRAYARGALVALGVVAVVVVAVLASGQYGKLADAMGPSHCVEAMEHHLALAEEATDPAVQSAEANLAEAYASAEFADAKCRAWSP